MWVVLRDINSWENSKRIGKFSEGLVWDFLILRFWPALSHNVCLADGSECNHTLQSMSYCYVKKQFIMLSTYPHSWNCMIFGYTIFAYVWNQYKINALTTISLKVCNLCKPCINTKQSSSVSESVDILYGMIEWLTLSTAQARVDVAHSLFHIWRPLVLSRLVSSCSSNPES